MYTNIHGERVNTIKPFGFIYEIVNDKGNISIVKKDCFTSTDKFCKNFFFVKKEKYEEDKMWNPGEGYNGFTKDTFCQNLTLYVDEYIHTAFRHFDEDTLRKEWNKQVEAFAISKAIPIYSYNININDFTEFLEYVKNNLDVEFDMICIKSKNDDICIRIYLEDLVENHFEEIEFYIDEDDAPSLTSYAEEWDWDEGIEGTISLEKFNEYFKKYGGVDLTKSYLSLSIQKTEEELEDLAESIENASCEAEHDFLLLDAFFSGSMYKKTNYYLLPTFENSSGEYIYELVGNKIFAYGIISEDDDSWYTFDKKFKKNDIKSIPQFNPKEFSNMYSNNLDELIEAFNNNLKKFLV